MQTSSPHSKKMEDDGFSSGNLSGSDIETGVNRRMPQSKSRFPEALLYSASR